MVFEYFLGLKDVRGAVQLADAHFLREVEEVGQVERPVLVEMHDRYQPFAGKCVYHLFHIAELKAFEDPQRVVETAAPFKYQLYARYTGRTGRFDSKFNQIVDHGIHDSLDLVGEPVEILRKRNELPPGGKEHKRRHNHGAAK